MELATRAAYRGQVTKIAKAAADYLKDHSSQVTDANVLQFDEIEEELVSLVLRLKAVNDCLNTINEDLKQKGLLKPEDPPEKIVEYQDLAIGVLARLEMRLAKLRQKQNPTPASVEPNNTSLGTNSFNGGSKLPKLPLKRFDGSFDCWLPFWEQFRSAVHENSNLTAPEKFNYLESVLIGEAKKSIAGFTPSERCYEAAVSLLQEQYGNTDKLIDNHIQQLINLAVVRDRADVSGLRNLYGKVIACTRSLTALQVPSSHYYVMLRSILLRCLPTDLRIDYHRQVEQGEELDEAEPSSNKSESSLSQIGSDDVKHILRFLKREVESLERSGVSHTNTKPKNSTLTTASSLIVVSDDTTCLFCKSKEHKTKECDSNISLSEKRNTLRTSGRCFRCAKRGHSSKKCRSSKFLSCNKCHGKHMTSMCDPHFESSSQLSRSRTQEGGGETSSALNLCAYNIKSNIFLKTVRCAAQENNQLLSIRAIIDGGSQYTYLRESVAKKLKLKCLGEIKLSVIPFGSKKVNSLQIFTKVRINLRSELNDGELISLDAVVVPEICVDVLEVPQEDCALFRSLQLADARPKDIEIENGLSLLIGSNFYWSVITGRQRRLTNRLRAIETVFGWALQGIHTSVSESMSTSNENPRFSSSTLLGLTQAPEATHDFWSLETIGILNNDEEHSALTKKLIDKCIARDGSLYVAKLPWKDSDSVLPNNKAQACKRLDVLYRRLSRYPAKLLEYDAAIQKLVNEGIAEPVQKLDDQNKQRVFYLPHRPVYKEESLSTKLRVVFDASAHQEGTRSLNDLLWTGANLLPDVLMVLLNFRLGPFGVVADIEKAFLQIVLHEDDRDSHRFLWYENGATVTSGLPKRCEFRMTRVTFGVNCSPFLLCATIRSHIASEKHQFAETCAALKNIYMDDLAISANTEEEALRICTEAITIFKRASMNLHKWNSNSTKVRDVTSSTDHPAVQKVLGLSWFVHSDELSVPFDSIESMLCSNGTRGTKRSVLQAIARIFDPLGILGPTTVKLKILFQILWKRKLLWDQFLTSDLLAEWEECVKCILELRHMTFPRAALSCFSNEHSIQIHLFADASTKAYGTVAFLRGASSCGQIEVRFLCAKNRIAPLKVDGDSELTLPKLELTAALIASRLHCYIKRSIKLTNVEYFFWTDSKIAINWIQGDLQRWKPYVQNRVDEIRRHTQISQWRHCKGKENPADLLTRGIPGEALQRSTLWAHGPLWLQGSDAFWETDSQDVSTIVATALLAETQTPIIPEESPLLPYRDYSTWKRLLRVTALILRFVRIIREKRITSTPPLDGCVAIVHLSSTEIQLAENFWFRYVQRHSFSNEFSLLQKGKILKASKIQELTPFLDEDGILRLGGRLQELDEPMDTKHPVILPSDSHIVNLIIDDCHVRVLHAGVNIVMTELRKRLWIIRARQIIKKRIKGCVICKKLWTTHASQPFAPLPIERIVLSRPFDNVGVDFAGPLYYYDDKHNAAKVYIAVFTCAAIRAVHLELVTSLSSENFLMALRRFIGRRGVPSLILSDNAKTFRRAAFELRSPDALWDEEVVQGFLSQRRIEWRFIVERAPWWGGFWERMIRTMKNLLKVTIGNAKLSYEQLRTLLVEVEEVINSRPLTYQSSDPLDMTPLTPNHFLIEPRDMLLKSSPRPATDADVLRGAWKQRMKFLTKIKRRWHSEYLQLLRSFHFRPDAPSIQLRAGDVVLVSDPSTSRINWKMAVVDEVFIGRDQRVRSCLIRLSSGKQFRRPIQLLYPLELSSCPAEDVKK